MATKMELSLDDIIKTTPGLKKLRGGGRGGGRGGRGGRGGGGGFLRRSFGGGGGGGVQSAGRGGRAGGGRFSGGGRFRVRKNQLHKSKNQSKHDGELGNEA